MSDILQKKLARAEARVAILERMIEDKTRQLYLANEDLRATNESLSGLYRVLPGAIVAVDAEGVVVEANEATLALLGYPEEEFLGAPAERFGLAHRLDGDDVWHREEAWRAADGTSIPVLVSSVQQRAAGEVRAVVSVAVDLRARKRQEVDLRHRQKLEAIGQLAAGIAHEINTPMQFIGDNVEFLSAAFEDVLALVEALGGLLEAPPRSAAARAAALEAAAEAADLEYLVERVPQAFERTREGVRRVASIVTGMKVFSHPGRGRTRLDLNAAVETTLAVARHELEYVTDVELDLGPLPPILAQSGDINQVLLNLVVNAAHAIETQRQRCGDEARGIITIATRHEGEVVEIRVSDTGCGIPPEVLGRIFEPFFTTKEVGKGTGQGLALVHAVIVDRHQGTVEVESEPGVGTSFLVRLPVDGAPAEHEVAA